MDEEQMLSHLRGMDEASLTGFITSLRSNATLKLALRTMGKAKGVGSMIDILLDESVPPGSLVAFFTIAQMPEEDRQAAVTTWIQEHPDLAPRVKAL